MNYGTLKLDTIVYTSGGFDSTVTVSGLANGASGVFPSGTAAATAITVGSSGNGLYSPGTNQVAISTSGVGRLFIDGTGQVETASLGTAAAPVYSFVNDPNTGIYSPGADQLAISTGGSGRLFVDASGNVGIGTATPDSILGINNVQGGIRLFFDRPSYNNIFGGFNHAGDSGGFGIYNVNSSVDRSIRFLRGSSYAGLTESARFDSSGRLGIGTTSPSGNLHSNAAYTNTSDLQVIADGNIAGFNARSSAGGRFSLATGYIGANITSLLTSTSTSNPSSEVMRFTHSTGEIDFFVGGSGAAKIDASRRLLVGTSSARSNFFGGVASRLQLEGDSTENSTISIVRNSNDADGPTLLLGRSRGTGNTVVQNGDRIGRISFQGNDGSNFLNSTLVEAYVDGTPGTNDMPTRLVFSTTADGASSPTERMRIRNDGQIWCYSSASGIFSGVTAGAGTTTATFVGQHSATGVNNGTNSFIVWSNGNVVNTNNSYGAISDLKLKENIVDSNSQWDDIKALQVRNYNFKEGQTHTQIGLIAQEVELVSPGLVSESPDRDEDGNDLGTVTKSVNYSVLYMKAVKALQEAMERIETLEAKVAALETA